MAECCDECEEAGPLSLCRDCADKLRDQASDAENDRDTAEISAERIAGAWTAAAEAALEAIFGKRKTWNLSVADLAAHPWAAPLLNMLTGKGG